MVGSSSRNRQRPRLRRRHVSGQFQPLRLAAGERVRRLPQADVIEADVDQPLQPGLDLGLAAEEGERLADGHFQDFGDVAAAVGHVEDLIAIARAAALAALHVDVGEELHVDLQPPVAVTDAAPPAVDVEAEMPGVVVPRPRLDGVGEHGANLVERLQISDRVAPRRAADRALIDHHHVVDLPVAVNIVQGIRLGGVLAQAAANGRIKRVLHQRALARSAHAGDQAEQSEGKLDGDALQVVAAGAGQANPAVIGRPAAAPGDRAAAGGEILAGEAAGRLLHLLRRSLKDDASAALARSGPDLDHLVRRADHRLLVLDDDDGVRPPLEPPHGVHQSLHVAGMQADRRLVEHVEHVHQAGAERGGQRDATRLAAAERAERAVQGKVIQPDRLEIGQPRLHLFEHDAGDAALPGR